MKKKKDEERKKRYLVVDVDEKSTENEDCMCCPCHRAIDIDVIPENILERLDPDYLKPRLGFDIDKKKIIITTVINLCDCTEDDEIDEDSETVQLGDVTLILP